MGVGIAGELLGEDQALAELGEQLDEGARREVDGVPHDGEVQAQLGADIAGQDLTVVQRDLNRK